MLQQDQIPAKPFLKLKNISIRFGEVQALNKVSFQLERGEIHALLGENGAGKSTLIKILGGVYQPNGGHIEIDGKPLRIQCVADADKFGIRIIHQELSLCPNLSIAENIFLNREDSFGGLISRRSIYKKAEVLIKELELNELADVRKNVSNLTVAHQQLVEIARALSCKAEILVLDEPTSSLSETETHALFQTLKRLREQGVGMIYISHRLDEIIQITDRITVIRDGSSIGTQVTRDVNKNELVTWMVGREIQDYFHRPDKQKGNVALSVSNLIAKDVNNVSFEINHGEILGFAGLVGAGRSELAKTIFGINQIHSGKISINGKDVSINCPAEALKSNLVMVPEDRKSEGLAINASVGFNGALPWTRDWIDWKGPNIRKQRGIIDRIVKNFHVKVLDYGQVIAGLSGGNQQKVLVGRWMEHRPDILILDEPTRGVDVGAREELFIIIGQLVKQSMAVMLISSDLEEVLKMSHRIAIYKDGHILEILEAGKTSQEYVMKKLTKT